MEVDPIYYSLDDHHLTYLDINFLLDYTLEISFNFNHNLIL